MLLLFLFRSISLGCLLDLQQRVQVFEDALDGRCNLQVRFPQLGILELNGHPDMVVMQ